MQQFLFGRYAWPFVGLGGLVAAACLASTWYINRLQVELARGLHEDAARMEAAQRLQVRLRQLRFHALVTAADPGGADRDGRRRRDRVEDDRLLVATALAAAKAEATPEDRPRLDEIERAYRAYEAALTADLPTEPAVRSGPDLIRWADRYPVQGLLDLCQELVAGERGRMDVSLERGEAQAAWAGCFSPSGSPGPWGDCWPGTPPTAGSAAAPPGCRSGSRPSRPSSTKRSGR